MPGKAKQESQRASRCLLYLMPTLPRPAPSLFSQRGTFRATFHTASAGSTWTECPWRRLRSAGFSCPLTAPQRWSRAPTSTGRRGLVLACPESSLPAFKPLPLSSHCCSNSLHSVSCWRRRCRDQWDLSKHAHPQGPYDHPPTWSTFEGIMYRRCASFCFRLAGLRPHRRTCRGGSRCAYSPGAHTAASRSSADVGGYTRAGSGRTPILRTPPRGGPLRTNGRSRSRSAQPPLSPDGQASTAATLMHARV